jgi:hydrogenase maturation protein HypF
MAPSQVGARRVAVRITGVVQGVGFRPFVYGAAHGLGLSGFVGNDVAGVFIEAQGDPVVVEQFVTDLRGGPVLAQVDAVAVTEIPAICDDGGFRIVASLDYAGVTSIPPDTAVCADCLAEMREPTDRRHAYPFIACTNCGPRYTIVTGLPYDRPFTTMDDFPMCAYCQGEYDDPRSRRFHAQPTACPECGPRLDTEITTVAQALRDGLIVAIKGIGGYHLACDAGDAAAVGRLRDRKRRGDKPFALMVSNLDVARRTVMLDETAEVALTSPARPIVLAPSLDSRLQRSVASGNSYLGVMLAYAPLHYLLFDAGAPEVLVMTSGNLSDEPICTGAQEAEDRLGAVADVFVHHDRRIHVACDDSVLRATGGVIQPVRRSRGYAPLPITLNFDTPDLLAVGGELKATICVASGRLAWMSQHIGDIENLETLLMLERTVATLSELQRVEPSAIVSDAHPAYLSRRWAEQEASRRGVAHLTVQHHHAHVASLLTEHGWPADRPVLAFAFDGTGFGTDGSIWGGELLLGSYREVQRVGHLKAVPLPGGDAAIRRPLRSALAHLSAAGVEAGPLSATVRNAEANELSVIARMFATGAGCTSTTSMGRLFDAVASLLDVRQEVDYEGQAAIELEALAATVRGYAVDDLRAWAPRLENGADGLILNPEPTIRATVAAASAGMDRGVAARMFHEGLAMAVVAAALEIRAATGVATVGLTGGVFANSVLGAACCARLRSEDFTVLVHERVPPNDGGLALGQIAVAAAGGASSTR